MSKQYYLTQTGIDNLNKEKTELIEKRVEIATTLKLALSEGDLRENYEYQSAKQTQEQNENRIKEINAILKKAVVIRNSGNNSITLGSTVDLENRQTKQKVTFEIVGTIEADPSNFKISDESPLGQSLIGKKVGQEVSLKNRATEFVILKVY